MARRAATRLVRVRCTDTLRAAPQRRLQLHELRQRHQHPVDGLKEVHELAGGLRSTQLTQSLGVLGTMAHRLSGEDFPTLLDFLSDENGLVGCS